MESESDAAGPATSTSTSSTSGTPQSSHQSQSSQNERLTEVAARIFFQLFGFCQNALNRMSKEQQLQIFQQHWPELFVLNAVETKSITSRQIRRSSPSPSSQFSSPDSSRNSHCQVAQYFETIENLQLNPREFAFLKIYSLNKQTQQGCMIAFQLASMQHLLYPRDPLRFFKCVQAISNPPTPSIIDVLFRQSIGNASMNLLINDMFQPKILLPGLFSSAENVNFLRAGIKEEVEEEDEEESSEDTSSKEKETVKHSIRSIVELLAIKEEGVEKND